MVHTAVAYARMKNRLQTYAVSSSVGPGATNMVTGAALATINRLPVLLLPADTFADRSASPLLQELELPYAGDVTVNDVFRPVSKYFDRIWRPEQLPAALLAAMRVLTDPAETGAVTLCFPQDVQAEAYDWPAALFDAPGLARRPAAAGAARSLEAAAEVIKQREAAADRGRRRGALLRRHRGAGGASARPPAFRSGRPRPARAPWSTTTRSAWARSARPAPRRPTPSPATRTW